MEGSWAGRSGREGVGEPERTRVERREGEEAMRERERAEERERWKGKESAKWRERANEKKRTYSLRQFLALSVLQREWVILLLLLDLFSFRLNLILLPHIGLVLGQFWLLLAEQRIGRTSCATPSRRKLPLHPPRGRSTFGYRRWWWRASHARPPHCHSRPSRRRTS